MHLAKLRCAFWMRREVSRWAWQMGSHLHHKNFIERRKAEKKFRSSPWWQPKTSNSVLSRIALFISLLRIGGKAQPNHDNVGFFFSLSAAAGRTKWPAVFTSWGGKTEPNDLRACALCWLGVQLSLSDFARVEERKKVQSRTHPRQARSKIVYKLKKALGANSSRLISRPVLRLCFRLFTIVYNKLPAGCRCNHACPYLYNWFATITHREENVTLMQFVWTVRGKTFRQVCNANELFALFCPSFPCEKTNMMMGTWMFIDLRRNLGEKLRRAARDVKKFCRLLKDLEEAIRDMISMTSTFRMRNKERAGKLRSFPLAQHFWRCRFIRFFFYFPQYGNASCVHFTSHKLLGEESDAKKCFKVLLTSPNPQFYGGKEVAIGAQQSRLAEQCK